MKHVAEIQGRLVHTSLVERNVNIPLILRLIEALQRGDTLWHGGPVVFSQRVWMQVTRRYSRRWPEPCRTSACIAGHVVILEGGLFGERITQVGDAARDALRIDDSEAIAMFGIPTTGLPDRQQAIDMLERYLATGRVVWA